MRIPCQSHGLAESIRSGLQRGHLAARVGGIASAMAKYQAPHHPRTGVHRDHDLASVNSANSVKGLRWVMVVEIKFSAFSFEQVDGVADNPASDSLRVEDVHNHLDARGKPAQSGRRIAKGEATIGDALQAVSHGCEGGRLDKRGHEKCRI